MVKKNTRDVDRFLVLMRQTFRDMFTMKGLLVKVIVLSLIPILITVFSTQNLGSVSILSASTHISATLLFPTYIWTLGIPFAIILSISTAPFLAGDIESHRLLILGSKPFGRFQFLMARFLGAFMHGIILCFFSVVCVVVFSVIFTSGKIDHFISTVPFMFSLALYGTVVSFFFTSLGFGISSLTTNTLRAGVIAATISIIVFLGPYLLRSFAFQIYEDAQFYHFDVSYHLGNALVFFIMSLNSLPNTSVWQDSLSIFTNVFISGSGIDTAQGFEISGMNLIGYYLPWVSILVLTCIALLLLIIGGVKFSRRDIT